MEKPDPSLGMSRRAVPGPLTATFAMQTAMSMAVLAPPVFAVEMAADLGVPAGWIGLYMTVVFAGAMIGGVLGGTLVERFGGLRVTQGCLVLVALGLAGLTAGLLLPVGLAAFAMGLAYGPPTPASSHILAKVTPRPLMPLVFSLKQTGVPAGVALAGAMVPPIVLVAGWRGAALAVAGFCLAAAAAFQPMRKTLDVDRNRSARFARDPLVPLRLVLRDRPLRRMAFLSFAYSAVQMSSIAYLVAYLVEDVRIGLVEAGVVLAVAQVAGIAGRVLWGVVSGRWIAPRVLLGMLGLVMAGATAAVALFGSDWPHIALYVTAAVLGATAIGWNGVFLAELARIAPEGRAGAATGGTVFVTFGGVMAAPAVFSALMALGGGYHSGFWMLAAVALGGVVLMAWPAARTVRDSASGPGQGSV